MQALSDEITKTQSESQLLVVRGEPTELLPELWKRWNITHLVIEKVSLPFFARLCGLLNRCANIAVLPIGPFCVRSATRRTHP